MWKVRDALINIVIVDMARWHVLVVGQNYETVALQLNGFLIRKFCNFELVSDSTKLAQSWP